jgi:hypothetical protein
LETAQQVARTLPFSSAPATSLAAGKEGGPNRRVEPARPAASVVGGPAAPAVQGALALQPPPAPTRVGNSRIIEIERFVPRAQIDPRYYDTPYYIRPRDEFGQEAYAVIRDAMRPEGMVGSVTGLATSGVHRAFPAT